MGKWAAKWQMKFNVDKCKMMHLGKNNPDCAYTLMGSTLAVTTQERDRGVIAGSLLKTAATCSAVI